MTAGQRFAWVLGLVLLPLAHAASPDGFGVSACRRGSTVDVWSEVSQDEGGTSTRRGQFALGDGGVRWESMGWPPPPPQGGQLQDGGLVWPALRDDGALDWGDAGCRSLRPVRLRLDARLAPAPLGPEALEALQRHGAAALPALDLWARPLARRLELTVDGGVVATLDLSLAGTAVELEGYDVGDGRHLLLGARWTFTHNEGAPVGDLAVQLIRLDASAMRTAPDGGAVLTVRLPPSGARDDGWSELTRLTEAAAQALEARRSPRAPELRALASRRHRQQHLARSKAFAGAQAACTSMTLDVTTAGPARWQPLVGALFALHDATRAADWPLVVERLDWSRSSCGDALAALPADGGTTLWLYEHPYER